MQPLLCYALIELIMTLTKRELSEEELLPKVQSVVAHTIA